MNLQYSIEIHSYPDDKNRKNKTIIYTPYKQVVGELDSDKYNYCCDEMKKAFYHDHVTISYNRRNFHVKYGEQSEILKEPVICLKTFDEDFDYEYGLEEYNLPIKFCPFCAKEITCELIEKKKITH